MRSSETMFDLPLRQSLYLQVARSIHKGIERQNWNEFLPSERQLCEIFQVSRPTIRAALHKLVKDGVVATHQGRRSRVLSKPNGASDRTSRLVGLVTLQPFSQMALPTYQGISEMRAHLTEHGFTSEVLICPPGKARLQQRKLEEFVRRNRVLCCVLLSVNKEIHQWFVDHGVPALVLGSCHPGIKLPWLDVDYRSVCRHAAGIFLAKGHRRIALLVPNAGMAGDLASEQGFLEAVDQHGNGDGAKAMIVRHSGTAQTITSNLNVLFNSAQAPTALLVARPRHVFSVIIYLLTRGLTVPDTVSLMARDPDPVFEFVRPQISHYTFANETLAHRLSRLMLQLVNQGHLPAKPNLIFPKYFAGKTVKQID